MDNITYEIEYLINILNSQKEKYTQLLSSSPPGGLIKVKRKHDMVFMHSVPDGVRASGGIKYRKKVITESSNTFKQLALKEYLWVSLRILDRNIRCLEHAKAGLLPLGYTVRHFLPVV